MAGDSLPERIRSTTFAILGLAAAAVLGLVALFAQPGFPLLSMGPLPSPSAGHQAVGHGLGLTAGPGAGGRAGTGRAPGAPLWSASATASSLGTGETGPMGVAFVLPTLAADHAAGTGASQLGGGGGGSQQDSPWPVITPAQPLVAAPESIPVSTPVSGSSSSSGLYVRSSVVNGKGEVGDVSEGSPVPGPEPEAPPVPGPEPEAPPVPTPEPEAPPVPGPEPEVPAEPGPEPEVPAEPGPEPEVPAESGPEPEVPAESGSDPEASPPESSVS